MDGMDEVKKALDEDGYYICANGYVIVDGRKSPWLHTTTPEEEVFIEDAFKSVYEKAMIFSKEMIEVVNEVLPEIMQRTPEEIKRDIKYEKNPMRLKQLNRELNLSYKFYKKGK